MAKKKKDDSQTQEPVKEPTESEQVSADTDVDELAKKLSETESKLQESEKKSEEMNNSLLRLRADFENYRRRNALLRTDSLEEGRIEVISAMLKTLDNFERAISIECSDVEYASGMKMIFNMMKSSLCALGLEEIEANGAFDPNFHEAVIQEESDDAESGSIIAILQKGYTLNGKVIRPTMVKVAK